MGLLTSPLLSYPVIVEEVVAEFAFFIFKCSYVGLVTMTGVRDSSEV